jgi:hypothetical protein
LLSKKIENTEELLALKQSTASNTLLSVDLAQSLFLVCLAFAGCVGAIFGKLLLSHFSVVWLKHPYCHLLQA